MIGLLLFAIASANGKPAKPTRCPPVVAKFEDPAPSAIEDHRELRKAIGEPMPQASTMVMLYGKGGHLATEEYSIIVVRSTDGVWRGTAVGRSRIWIQDAPYSPMRRAEWSLDAAAGRRLYDAISRYCPNRSEADHALDGAKTPPPPPLGLVAERIDIVTPERSPSTLYLDQGNAVIAALIRPPSGN